MSKIQEHVTVHTVQEQKDLNQLINKFTKYEYDKDNKSNVYISLYYLKYFHIPFSFDFCHNSELGERNVNLFLGKETGAQKC